MTEEQPQPAVVELPYDALAGALRDFADELDPTDWHEDYRIMLERAAVVIESAAAVRAEAVAAERQRIEAVLNGLDLFAADAPHNPAAWQLRDDLLAAGSVPVATQPTCDHGQTEGHWATGTNEFGYGSTSVWCVGAVPVAAPTEPKTADAWSWGGVDTTPSDAIAVERLKGLCAALGEPYERAGDHPGEPPWVMTWERALDIVRGRTAVWRDLLRRAEEVDGAWLAAYRGKEL